MREIKFRAYNNQVQKMTDWSTIKKYRNLEKLMTLDHVDLMQYTGSKDKNSVEIYEGDIVKAFDHDYGIGYVDFRDGCFLVVYDEEDFYFNEINLDLDIVIGNIYENKELLDGTM